MEDKKEEVVETLEDTSAHEKNGDERKYIEVSYTVYSRFYIPKDKEHLLPQNGGNKINVKWNKVYLSKGDETLVLETNEEPQGDTKFPEGITLYDENGNEIDMEH